MSSLRLEDLVLRHPGLVEEAVIGVPDPKWIERPQALLVAKAGQKVSEVCKLDAKPPRKQRWMRF